MKYLAQLYKQKHSPLIILALALLLSSTSLITGYFGDDYLHHALLSQEKPFPKPNDWSLFGLFSFANGDPVRNQMLRDYSLIPWWTNEGLKYAFWRPVSELTHWVDHTLWHESPALMHAHNLAWYAALCYLISIAYRKLSTATLAATCGLAAYALDSTHGFGLGWISNRNALVSATFGIATLLTYINWRENYQLRYFAISLTLLALTLLSAEAGISVTAYLGAYALILDKKGAIKGLIALIPFALVTVAWWIIYKQLGFGAENADAYYVDPTTSPSVFLIKLIERIPVLLASQFGVMPAELYGFSGKTIPAYVIACALYLVLVFALMYRVIRNQSSTRFWLLGTAFALAPISTALPHDRNLFFVGIGASMLIGELFQYLLLLPAAQTIKTKLFKTISIAFLSIHLVLAPLLLPLTAYSPRVWTSMMNLNAVNLPVIDEISSKSVLLFGTPLPAALGLIPIRYAEKQPIPNKLWTATTLQQDVTLFRKSETELVLTNDEGFITGVEESLRNLKTVPFQTNDQIPHSGMTITVLEINEEGHPTKFSLTFARGVIENLEVLKWNKENYTRMELPDTNESILFTWK